jgi:hypothetical protein
MNKMITPSMEKGLRIFLKAQSVPDQDWRLFVDWCNDLELNPFIREVYITDKMGGKSTIGIQIDGWRKIAIRKDKDYCGTATFQIRLKDVFKLLEDGKYEHVLSFAPKKDNPVVAAMGILKRVGKPDLQKIVYADEWKKPHGVWGSMDGLMLEIKAERELIRKCYCVELPKGLDIEEDLIPVDSDKKPEKKETPPKEPTVRDTFLAMAKEYKLIVGKNGDKLIELAQKMFGIDITSTKNLTDEQLVEMMGEMKKQ